MHNMVFTITYALKSILRRKQKNLITAIAIALGVALFIGTQAASNGVLSTITKINLENQGNSDISIYQPTSPNGMFSGSVSHLIRTSMLENPKLQNIETVADRIKYTGSVYQNSTGEFQKNVVIKAINPDDQGFGEFINLKGKSIPISTTLVDYNVIISHKLMKDMRLKISDNIQISVPDGLGNATTITLTIIDIYNDNIGRGTEDGGVPGDSRAAQLYFNLETAQSKLNPTLRNYLTDIQITVKGVNRDLDNFDIKAKTFPGKEKIQATLNELQDLLNGYDGLLIYSQRVYLVDSLGLSLSGISSILLLFAIILNGVALLLVINVQSMAVDDRKNQTAVLRALGANISTITMVFLLEASIIGMIGAVMGLALGYLVSLWILEILSQVYGATLSSAGLTTGLVLTAVLSGVILSILTAVIPSMKAAKVGIANSLRGLDDAKIPRKSYWTLIFGLLFFPLGLLNATHVGNLADNNTWESFDNQISILLGFGLTLAGLGLLLTRAISRKIALNITGVSLFSLGTFFFVWAIGKGKGDGGNLFGFLLLYMIVGSSIVVSVNYDRILNLVGKIFTLGYGNHAITQVTVNQMKGKKNRGVMVYTILTVILLLTIFIASAAQTQRVSIVNAYDGYSDGVDILVATDNAFSGTADRIRSLNDRVHDQSIGHIKDVFGFRRTNLPIYLVSPLDDNFDISTDMVSLTVSEIAESTIKPNGIWDEQSLKLQFRKLSDEIQSKTGLPQIDGTTSKSEHAVVRDKTFNLLFSDFTREKLVTYSTGAELQSQTTENQQMVLGGYPLEFINLGLTYGSTIYIQAVNGSIIPLFIGGTLEFDMLGDKPDYIYGNTIIVPPSIAGIIPYENDKENLFLVRSDNGYRDIKANKALASIIEADLNNLNDPSSFSSIQTPANLIGASATVIKDEIAFYYAREASFWDFLRSFTTLGLVIGTLGMMIIAVRSVTERTREIGMMRSIGFSKSSVVLGVIIEMLVLSLLSVMVGLFIALIMVESFTKSALGVKAVYPIWQILEYIIGLLCLAIISGVIPGYNASKVAPSHALRYTG